MPVWHRETKALRESGKLTVIGITQEQHADRCLLFARWQGLDWPILWDPFNLTGTYAVPRATLIDEHGIVRSLRFDPKTIEKEFLARTFEAPRAIPPEPPDTTGHDALSKLLWPGKTTDWSALETLQTHARANPKNAAAWWRLGVAERMRHDSPARRPTDFQNALDHWGKGLELNPRQYIYRRRIQQYGPRLDKPYPFYPWIEEAQAALKKRGEKPVPLVADLSGAEVIDRRMQGASLEEKEPDPHGRVPSRSGLLETRSSVAWHTSPRKGDAARVHLHLRPASKACTLDFEAGPITVWLDLPEGWKTTTRRLTRRRSPRAERDGSVPFDFEVSFDGARGQAGTIRGYALFYACLDTSGECTYLRQPLEIPVRRTQPPR